MFNRNKDINSMILMNLNDEDLERICRDPAYKNVCGNDMFWRQRTINRFGSAFEEQDETSEKLLEKYSKQYAKNWREYYVSLIDFMQHIYNEASSIARHYTEGRKDLLNLIVVANANAEEIKNSIVVNPNIFDLLFNKDEFNRLYRYEDIQRYMEYSLNGFKYLLKLDDKRITPYLLISIMLRIFPREYEDISEISEIIRLTLNDPRITVDDIKDTLSDINDNNSVNHPVMDDYLNFVATKLSPEENVHFLRKIIDYLRGN